MDHITWLILTNVGQQSTVVTVIHGENWFMLVDRGYLWLIHGSGQLTVNPNEC